MGLVEAGNFARHVLVVLEWSHYFVVWNVYSFDLFITGVSMGFVLFREDLKLL